MVTSRLFLLTVLVALSGCATRPEWLANRLTCAVAGDKSYVASMWGPIGIASVIDDKDTAVLCQLPAKN
jgi:hypothetical protein